MSPLNLNMLIAVRLYAALFLTVCICFPFQNQMFKDFYLRVLYQNTLHALILQPCDLRHKRYSVMPYVPVGNVQKRGGGEALGNEPEEP